MTEITNIVPVEQKEVVFAEPSVNGEPLSPIEYSQKLATDAVLFLEEEFRENTCKEFWEIIRDSANSRLGNQNKSVSVNPMTEEQAKSFGKELVLWGKYTGQRVVTVLKKDKESLEVLANRPHPFQMNLLKFLALYQ